MRRVTTSSTAAKCKQYDFVYQNDLINLKERINRAFDSFLKLYEESINRDSVLTELLMET